MKTQNKYEVVFSDGMSFQYDDYSAAVDAITIVANKMQEFAVEVKEINSLGETIILYKPEYSAKLIWTEITEKGKAEL